MRERRITPGGVSRRPLVVGNWKMNGYRRDMIEFQSIDRAAAEAPSVDVALALPLTLLSAAFEKSTAVRIGGQDIHAEPMGAHTGCVSGAMVRDAGGSFVLIGHSEVRARGDEADAVRRKFAAAIGCELVPLLCVGETLEERRSGRTLASVAAQARAVEIGDSPELWVAYEPVWAIGTGHVATPEVIAEVHASLRDQLGRNVRLLYGGSVSPQNINSILSTPEVDGVLVGSASLRASTLSPIIEAAHNHATAASTT